MTLQFCMVVEYGKGKLNINFHEIWSIWGQPMAFESLVWFGHIRLLPNQTDLSKAVGWPQIDQISWKSIFSLPLPYSTTMHNCKVIGPSFFFERLRDFSKSWADWLRDLKFHTVYLGTILRYFCFKHFCLWGHFQKLHHPKANFQKSRNLSKKNLAVWL